MNFKVIFLSEISKTKKCMLSDDTFNKIQTKL